MARITIDDQIVDVEDGLSVMQAAALMGISIPSLCHLRGYKSHPSCMVCLVKDGLSGKMYPSCAMPVAEGMNIVTHSPELREARREALELLLSDHVGDCEAPCRVTCPAFMNIPLMNRLIAENSFEQALEVVHEEIALPLILGYICPAPCEKACRRKSIDGAVSICLLKRSAAQHYQPASISSKLLIKKERKVAIIGTGPAGLSAAFYLLLGGISCVLFDQNELPGGALRYKISPDTLPREVIDLEIEKIRGLGASFCLNFPINEENFELEILSKFDAVILATGSKSEQPVSAFGLSFNENGEFYDRKTFKAYGREGVFVCGNILKDQNMAVRAGAQGKQAAREVMLYLEAHKPEQLKPEFNSAFGHLTKQEESEYLKESLPGDRIEPAEGFLAGFNLEEAIEEAKRCMHCDCRKPVSCKLRLYADQYGANRKRFVGPERNMVVKYFQHEIVIYEPEKCIRCGLCIEITNREKESLGLAFVGRGFDVRVAVPFRETLKEGLEKTAREVVMACPTGALSLKFGEEYLLEKKQQNSGG